MITYYYRIRYFIGIKKILFRLFFIYTDYFIYNISYQIFCIPVFVEYT